MLIFLVKPFLTERRYVSIFAKIKEIFPELFHFQHCGVLFVDPVTHELFQLQSSKDEASKVNDPEEFMKIEMKQFQNVIKFPINIGITGQAIREDRILYYNEGDRQVDFSSEIDNSLCLPKVESLMVAPVRDQYGKCLGVIQLFNRLNGERIVQNDCYELGSLLPSLAEIYKTIQEVRKITNISGGLDEYLYYKKDNLISAISSLESGDVHDVSGMVSNLKFNIHEFSLQKIQDSMANKYI